MCVCQLRAMCTLYVKDNDKQGGPLITGRLLRYQLSGALFIGKWCISCNRVYYVIQCSFSMSLWWVE